MCEALNAAGKVFDDVLARRGVRLDVEHAHLVNLSCVECGAPHSINYYGLTDDERAYVDNLNAMLDRCQRRRVELPDELRWMLDEFRARYSGRCFELYGPAFAEAQAASEEFIDRWFERRSAEITAAFGRPARAINHGN